MGKRPHVVAVDYGNKRNIFRLLVEAGSKGMPAGALAEATGVPASSMSFHLAQLANAGLVTQRRVSRSIIYAADYAAMGGLMTYLTENCCAGEGCPPQAACAPNTISEKPEIPHGRPESPQERPEIPQERNVS